jgi:hypothetical protein
VSARYGTTEKIKSKWGVGMTEGSHAWTLRILSEFTDEWPEIAKIASARLS